MQQYADIYLFIGIELHLVGFLLTLNYNSFTCEPTCP